MTAESKEDWVLLVLSFTPLINSSRLQDCHDARREGAGIQELYGNEKIFLAPKFVLRRISTYRNNFKGAGQWKKAVTNTDGKVDLKSFVPRGEQFEYSKER